MREAHHHVFGDDAFGRWSEAFARFFGTPQFILGQTAFVVVWITLNTMLRGSVAWDVFPFILLNLTFSTQSAYAAPLILLAQRRQADRDYIIEQRQRELIELNTRLTEEIHRCVTLMSSGVEQ